MRIRATNKYDGFIFGSITLGFAMYFVMMYTFITAYTNGQRGFGYTTFVDINRFGEARFELIMLLFVGVAMLYGAYLCAKRIRNERTPRN